MGLVYQTCLREIGDADLASDAAQASFLVLAQTAPKLRRGTCLPSWLFTVARLTAKNFARQERRQQVRARALAESIERHSNVDAGWESVEPLLNDALGSLRESDRAAVILRYFEGRTTMEAASELGISEDTFRARLSRAIDRMRRHLAGEGIVIPAAILGSILLGNACVRANATPAFPGLAIPPDHVRSSAQRTLNLMVRRKFAAVGAGALGLLLIGAGVMSAKNYRRVEVLPVPTGWTGPIARYNAIDLTGLAETKPGSFQFAQDINNSGHVVWMDRDGGYLWSGSKITRLVNFKPYAINNSDELGGTTSSEGRQFALPAVWKHGHLIALPMLPSALDGSVNFINDSGVALGFSTFRAAKQLLGDPAVHTELGNIDAEIHPVMWKNGRVSDISALLPPSTWLMPVGLDARGDVLIFRADRQANGSTYYLVPAGGGAAKKLGSSNVAVSKSGNFFLDGRESPDRQTPNLSNLEADHIWLNNRRYRQGARRVSCTALFPFKLIPWHWYGADSERWPRKRQTRRLVTRLDECRPFN